MDTSQAMLDEQIAAVRGFNRFYTRQIGLLEDGLLKSGFSLTELRVLYELAHQDGLTAADLRRDLGLDAGYLSRILKKLGSRGFLDRVPSDRDARRRILALTAAGRAFFAPVEAASRDMVAGLLAPLSADERADLVKAMGVIGRLWGGAPAPRVPYILRPPQPGDMGCIVHRQTVFYNREYGWDESFEALIAEIVAAFIGNFDAKRERCWIAEREGEIVGSVFVVRDGDTVARLRLLYVEPAARGLGIGRRLVDECIRFARARGYTTLTLWTNDVLVAARRLYEAAGFELAAEKPNHSCGKDLVGQDWNLEL